MDEERPMPETFTAKFYKEGYDPRRQSDTQGLLFHYTKSKTALEYIFPSMHLKMSSMKVMNDLRESSPWEMSVMGDLRSEEHERVRNNLQALTERYFKSMSRVVCFSEDQPDTDPEHPVAQWDREDIVQGWQHDRMWAQYAENHTGICLFFDREKLHAQMVEHFAGRGHLLHMPVTYLDDRLRRNEEPMRRIFDPFDRYYNPDADGDAEDYVRRFREMYWGYMYFLKDPDWQSEQEYRYVWLADTEPDEDAEYIPIGDALKSICLGASFPKAYEINIRDVSERTGAQVLRIWYPQRTIFIVPAWEDARFERTFEIPSPSP